MAIKIYVSHTTDLTEFAFAAKQAIEDLGLDAVLLDVDTGFMHLPPMKRMYQLIRDCDFLLGIYSVRYGGIPETDHEDNPNNSQYSYIHWEYNWAKEFQIPVLPFLMGNNIEWKPNSYDANDPIKHEKMNNFKKQILGEFTASFYDDNFDSVYWSAIKRIAQVLAQRAEKTTASIFPAPSKLKQFQCDIFMVMPFRKELNPVYTDHIKPLAKNMGYEIKRGDDPFSHHEIMTEIWSLINNSKLIIADCTGRNPNVFYELGIAHTLGKPAIMITQSIEDIPFDVRGKRVIIYEYTPRGMKQFEEDLSKAIQSILT